MNTRETLYADENDRLIIGGADAASLAREYGTPLYALDEAHIRKMCAVFRDTLKRAYGNAKALYASKALSCLAVYKIIKSEGLGADVVSRGELFTALRAGFDAREIYFHGNNKTADELEYAVSSGVGTIVADSEEEIDLISSAARKAGVTQDILIRINPGVEAHTHHFVQTATVDSKFGFSVKNGQAEACVKHALDAANVRLKGVHSHIGSQIFEKKSFVLAVDAVTDFTRLIKEKYAFEFTELNFGGGFGIWYSEGDRKIPAEGYAEYAETLAEALKKACAEKDIRLPALVLEPGRSIVGEAGITLYTVGAIKEIPGVRKYVAVDGGMFDNPRYALYEAKYTAVPAERVNAPAADVVSVAGKCCESGDLISADIRLAKVKRGDILAVFSTGAYNYSMASNYNRNKIPPVVLVKDGKAELIVAPQTDEDLIRNDRIPERLK